MAALQEARLQGKSVGRQYSLMMPRGQQWYELSVVTKPTEPGDEERLIAIARNITERKLAEQAIEKLAFHDSLTGLPNRRMLSDRLQNRRDAQRPPEPPRRGHVSGPGPIQATQRHLWS